MKKHLLLGFFMLLIALMLFLPALGEEAVDISDTCKVSTSGGEFKTSRMYDRKYSTTWESRKQVQPFVQFSNTETAIHGVYICFGGQMQPWEIQVQKEDVWQTVYRSEGTYAHEYAPLDGVDNFKITLSGENKAVLSIAELYILSEGDLPSWVQLWQPTVEKADLMVLAAHPDDEILFFGGAIPYYAGELKKNVLVAYMTCGSYVRRSELLDGLWLGGVSNYPVIGSFWDHYASTADDAYKDWGKADACKFLVQLLRTYQPEVVVTHDVNGEYGHGAHRACADAMQACLKYAADPNKYPELGKEWQVKKLYLHLYGENTLEMDWDTPLSAFDGKTAFDVAKEMFLCHKSQENMGHKQNGVFVTFTVEPRDSQYSCYRFGLCYSAVGEDVSKNDFFENIPD